MLGTREQGSRFSRTQSGAAEQFTRFNTVANVAIISGFSDKSVDPMIFPTASAAPPDPPAGFTRTLCWLAVEALKESHTVSTEVRALPLDASPPGKVAVVEATGYLPRSGSSTRPEAVELGAWNPKENVNGRLPSGSDQPAALKAKAVTSSSPTEGLILKAPGWGGEFMAMVMEATAPGQERLTR